MSVNVNLDQHRLIINENGAIVTADDDSSFFIYDLISETSVKIPTSALNDTVAFLSQKEAVVIRVSESAEESAPTSVASPETSSSSVNSVGNSSHSSADSSTSSSEVWVKNSGKPSAIDLNAREDLINLIKSEKYQKLLKDKKTTKKFVFEEVSKELVKKGYSFGDREGWKVCQQKWKNMESETLKVLAAAGPNNTGGGQVKRPDYFDEVFDVVKDTAKACPKNIEDSLPQAKEVSEIDKGSEEDEGNSASPFLKVKLSTKPKEKRANEVLNFLKEESTKRDKQNEELLKFLKRKAKGDDKRKKAFLSLLKDLAGSKKRKKGSSEEESKSSSDEEESA